MTHRLNSCFAVILCSMSITSTLLGDCQCSRPQKGETTHWGGNMRIVVVDEKHYRQIRGVVRIQSDPDPIKEKEALVEIFTRPENLLQDRSTGSKVKSKQRRIAA